MFQDTTHIMDFPRFRISKFFAIAGEMRGNPVDSSLSDSFRSPASFDSHFR